MNRCGLLASIVFVIISVGYVHAQTDEIDLQSFLKNLELEHDVHFNYVSRQVEGLKLPIPVTSISLDSALSSLRSTFNLSIESIGDRYYLVHASVQRVCGYMVDENADPLAGVLISVVSGHTVSRSDGYFDLEIAPGDSILNLRHLSYLPKQLIISRTPDRCRRIILKESITQLAEVTVKTYVVPGISKQSGGAISLNLDEIGVLAGMTEADVLHSLQVLPGVQSFNETVSHLNVRGASNDQNYMTWEGMRLYQPGHFFGLITAVNPRMTNRVQLIKNGTPARLGGGTSGQILMQVDDRPVNEPHLEGGINMLNGDLFAAIPISQRSSLKLGVRNSLSQVVNTPTYEQYFHRAFNDTEVRANQGNPDVITTEEAFSFQDFSVKYRLDLNRKSSLSFSGLYIDNQLAYQERKSINTSNESKSSSLGQTSALGGIAFAHVGDRLSARSEVSFSSYALGAVNEDLINDQQLQQKNEVLDFSFRNELEFSPSDAWHWSMGVEFHELGARNFRSVNRPDFKSDAKDVIRLLAPYISFQWTSPSQKSQVYSGLRVSTFNPLQRAVIEPRISFTQQFLAQFYLEIQGERKSQYLTQIVDFQDDFLGVEKRKWVLADEETIPLLESTQLSVGPGFDSRNWLISLVGFYRHVDGVASASQGFQNQFERSRVEGETLSHGVEMLLNPQFNRWSGWLNYSWMRNHYYFGALVPPEFRSNFDIRHQASLGVKWQMDGFSASSAINWHTGRPYTPVNETATGDRGELVFDVPNSANLPNYLRWDISLSYTRRWTKRLKGTMGLSLWNLTNRANIINSYFIYNDGPKRIDNPALGFTPNILLRVEFN